MSPTSMDILDGNKRVFQSHGPGHGKGSKPQVCFYWRAGNCSRFPCPYLHRDLAPPRPWSANNNGGEDGASGRGSTRMAEKKTEKLCKFWSQGKNKCSYGENCRYLHSWSTGDSFSLMAQLEGHQEAVTGIAMPSGSDKLYTGSKDETARVWDCQSGQCTRVINMGGAVGCVLTEGPWVFIGTPNTVNAWNVQFVTELTLTGPVGQVYALAAGNGLLFAGTQDGTILAWRLNGDNCFEPAATLKGHARAVVTLVVGSVSGHRLYSGSMDHSIRVWSLETLECVQTLAGHTSVVMSVLCWDRFLLSCSLDKTIKVWAADGSGNLEVMYAHNEEHGLLTLCGMYDSEGKPVLLCACNDNSVRVYDLPSFSERGKIFSRQEVRSIQTGPGGVFFTGDGTGEVKVWRWLSQSTATVNSPS